MRAIAAIARLFRVEHHWRGVSELCGLGGIVWPIIAEVVTFLGADDSKNWIVPVPFLLGRGP